jgi:Putative prokaryotic signal transducing protein
MQIDPEEFRRHYDSLSDEALIEIDSDELVDVARQCYEEELARRGIAFETEPAVASAESATHESWVLAATYLTAEEANMAHAMLESAAIPARLASNNTSAWSGTGELRLMVPPEFLEEAENILASEISDEDLIAQAEAESPPDSADEE